MQNFHDVDLEKLFLRSMNGKKIFEVDKKLIARITNLPKGNFFFIRLRDEKPSWKTISSNLVGNGFGWKDEKFPTKYLHISLNIFAKFGIPNVFPIPLKMHDRVVKLWNWFTFLRWELKFLMSEVGLSKNS